uniref:Uncharacterized protein n=1 Tax=Thermomicrobium roseum TaxID=500 RepID=A0A7C1XPS8_THERO
MLDLGNGLRAIVQTAVILGMLLVVVACGAVRGSGAVSQPSPAILQPTVTPPGAPGRTVTVPTEQVELAIQKAALRAAGTNEMELVVDVTIPDTCTTARYEIGREGPRVLVRVWGERPTGMVCAQVIREEQLVIPLGMAPSGGFVVELNGVEVALGEDEMVKGEPGTDALERGLPTVDTAEVRVVEDTRRRVVIEVQGTLPDACAELAEQPSVSVADRRVSVLLEWERPRGLMCAQVLRPFTTTVDLGELEPGSYMLVVNDLETTFEVE